MGRLVAGRWTTDEPSADERGRFIRAKTTFRSWITADGSSGFPAEPGRYHLYVSLACPWAHRTLIARKRKKLEDVISLSVVDWHMGEDGWRFSDREGAVPDPVHGAEFLRDIYLAARPDYTGRVTVPVLWDRRTGTIVNNESRDIIEMFDAAFDAYGDPGVRWFPGERADEVARVIDALYEPINNGVYRCGFARTQEAYDEAFGQLFAALDHWDRVLAGRRYLVGPAITAADWCMFTTLLRMDLVYYVHFKCNLRHIYDYAQLGPYLRDLYQQPGVAETCNFDHIKRHYFESHRALNPRGLVPGGPAIDLDAPHDRARFDVAR